METHTASIGPSACAMAEPRRLGAVVGAATKASDAAFSSAKPPDPNGDDRMGQMLSQA